MTIKVLEGDITLLKVDAIVNAANSTLCGGGGVDGAIHKAAGPRLLEKCKTLGGCKTGEAKMTRGYDLPAAFIIHTVGPMWHGGQSHEEEHLKNCYINSLKLAAENGLKSIAFPCISTGAYHFPADKAALVAWGAVKEFLRENPSLDVYFVCHNAKDYKLYKKFENE